MWSRTTIFTNHVCNTSDVWHFVTPKIMKFLLVRQLRLVSYILTHQIHNVSWDFENSRQYTPLNIYSICADRTGFYFLFFLIIHSANKRLDSIDFMSGIHPECSYDGIHPEMCQYLWFLKTICKMNSEVLTHFLSWPTQTIIVTLVIENSSLVPTLIPFYKERI